jgi:hypothetical protein
MWGNTVVVFGVLFAGFTIWRSKQQPSKPVVHGFMEKKTNILVHDLVEKKVPIGRKELHPGCIENELSLVHKDGDVYIVTYPKTGTTALQFMCHLLRTNGNGTKFESIHQVSPNTTSAYLIGTDLKSPEVQKEYVPRLFKSHREIQQVSAFAHGVKFLSTVRDPITTLISCYNFRRERAELPADLSIRDFAFSSKWMSQFYDGSDGTTTIYDHIATFWKARNATNMFLIPFEDFTQNSQQWLPLIARFIGTPSNVWISIIIWINSLCFLPCLVF